MDLEVFGAIPSGIFIPDSPFAIRNNCQIGSFTLGSSEVLGNKLHLRAVKFSRFFGDLGQTQDEVWGQLFFLAEPDSGDIPQNIVCLTYLKTKSLTAFTDLVTSLLAKKINPAAGIFSCYFVKESRSIIKDGQILQANYYSLAWEWSGEKKSIYTNDQIASVVAQSDKLIDLVGTAKMVCLDTLSSQERAELISSRLRLKSAF